MLDAFIHSFDKYIVSSYYVPSTVLRAENITVSKISKVLAFMGFYCREYVYRLIIYQALRGGVNKELILPPSEVGVKQKPHCWYLQEGIFDSKWWVIS